MKPGIYHNIPEADYFAIEAVSKSELFRFAKNPWAWKTSKQLKIPFETTDAMEWGNAFEVLLLEPDLWEDRYEVLTTEKKDRQLLEAQSNKSKARKWSKALATYKAWAAQVRASGRIPVTQEYLGDLMFAVGNAKENIALHGALEHGESQVVLIWEDPDTGLKCKARTDWIPGGDYSNAIMDIKTTRSDSERSMQRQVADLGYHVQAAFYLDGLEACGDRREQWLLGCVVNRAPYEVNTWYLDQNWIEAGRKHYRDAIRLWEKCHDEDLWPGLTDGWEALEAPGWIK